MAFVLDPRIAADSSSIAALPLCDLRLQSDRRFPWLVLVPRRAGLTEIEELSAQDRQQLVEEVVQAGAALRAACAAEARPLDKINVGALGNIVRQLHVHVVGRLVGDAAWPGPVWGFGVAERWDPDAAARFSQAVALHLSTARSKGSGAPAP